MFLRQRIPYIEATHSTMRATREIVFRQGLLTTEYTHTKLNQD